MTNPDVRHDLRRAEGEIWLTCLFAFHTHAALRDAAEGPAHAVISPRYAGMFESFRAHPAFVDVCALPTAAEFGRGCAAFIEAQPFRTLPPEVHHILSLYFADVTAALSQRPSVDADAVARALTRSLAHWLYLEAEATYLRGWIRRLAEGEVDANALLESFMARRVAVWTARVRQAFVTADLGATSGILRALSPQSREKIWALAELPPAAGAGLRRAIRDGFEGLVQEAMDSFLREMEVAQTKGEAAPERSARVMTAGLRLSTVSQEFEEAENLVLERAEQVGWDLRRGKHWKSLASLYGALRPLVLRLGDRVERDPEKFAFAARAAQALTFLADATEDMDERITLTERGLALCPGHPMAQTMLSFYLASKGLRIIRNAAGPRDAVHREARALYDRAKALDPKDEAVKRLGDLLASSGA